jgi:hypothetical protein
VVSVPQLSATSIINSGLTSGRVVYSTTSGLETDSANLTFNGTILTSTGFAGPINGTVGATTPSTGAFTTLSATGVATFSAGSAAAPAITTTGDTNTGIFFPAADTIAFAEGGAEAMRLDSSGNLGIGTTSPGSRLSVVGGSLATAGTGILAAGALTAGRLVSDGVNATVNPIHTYFDSYAYEISAGSTSGYVTGVVVAARSFTGTGGEGVSFWTRSAERMRIDGSGNVGIGTSSPVDKLQVEGNIYLGTTGRTIYQGSSADLTLQVNTGNIKFFRANGVSESMRLDSSGNLGIGTSSPGAKLDVQGANAYVRIKATSGTYALFDIDSPAAQQPIIRFLSNGVEQARILSPVNEAASQLMFTTGSSSTERMRIDASGNVGIGTSSPSVKLQVVTATASASIDTNSTMLGIGGTADASGALRLIGFGFKLNTFYPAYIGAIQTSSAGNTFSDLGFYTRSVTTDTAPTERMRIDSSGNLLVGTTASAGDITNTAPVVAGVFKTLSGTVSAATATATTIATLPNVTNGTYIVSCGLAAGDPTNYSAVSLVTVDATVLRITNLQTAAFMSITISGQTVRVTQTSGITQTVYFTLTRVS